MYLTPVNYTQMQPTHTKHPVIPLPRVPPSLSGYTDLFRQYCVRVQKALVWRSSALDVAFNNGLGSMSYLFLLANAEVGYMAFLTCCQYWDSRDEYISRPRLLQHLGYSRGSVDGYIKQALTDGHITKMYHHAKKYTLTYDGKQFILARTKQFYNDILSLHDII